MFKVNEYFDSGWGPGLCPGVHFRREGSSLDGRVKSLAFSTSEGPAQMSFCVHEPSISLHMLPVGFLSRSSGGRRSWRTLS